MRTILILTLVLLSSCTKTSDCYVCEKDNQTLRYCEDSFYSPNTSLDETINSLRNDGYDCDYYKD